jgi:hypothetical protein
MKLNTIFPALLVVVLAGFSVPAAEVVVNGIEGSQDTPLQPDGKWHVNDPARPQPAIVTPGKTFSENAMQPSDAIILFDGTNLSQWRDQKTGGEPFWKVSDGVAVSAKGTIMTTNQFGNLQLHLEFREPTPPKGNGQRRGNSGVILMNSFEIQILDCYDNPTYADGTTGAIYNQHPPLVNACRPPGEWETYDIIFSAPHFDADGKLTLPAYATVILNGVVLQNHQAIRGDTRDTHNDAQGKYKTTNSQGPLALQFHNNAVAFRNIWARPVAENNEP